MYNGVGVSFADFISISHENEIIWSHIFIGFLKTGGGGVRISSGPLEMNPLNPFWTAIYPELNAA